MTRGTKALFDRIASVLLTEITCACVMTTATYIAFSFRQQSFIGTAVDLMAGATTFFLHDGMDDFSLENTLMALPT